MKRERSQKGSKVFLDFLFFFIYFCCFPSIFPFFFNETKQKSAILGKTSYLSKRKTKSIESVPVTRTSLLLGVQRKGFTNFIYV